MKQALAPLLIKVGQTLLRHLPALLQRLVHDAAVHPHVLRPPVHPRHFLHNRAVNPLPLKLGQVGRELVPVAPRLLQAVEHLLRAQALQGPIGLAPVVHEPRRRPKVAVASGLRRCLRYRPRIARTGRVSPRRRSALPGEDQLGPPLSRALLSRYDQLLRPLHPAPVAGRTHRTAQKARDLYHRIPPRSWLTNRALGDQCAWCHGCPIHYSLECNGFRVCVDGAARTRLRMTMGELKMDPKWAR